MTERLCGSHMSQGQGQQQPRDLACDLGKSKPFQAVAVLGKGQRLEVWREKERMTRTVTSEGQREGAPSSSCGASSQLQKWGCTRLPLGAERRRQRREFHWGLAPPTAGDHGHIWVRSSESPASLPCSQQSSSQYPGQQEVAGRRGEKWVQWEQMEMPEPERHQEGRWQGAPQWLLGAHCTSEYPGDFGEPTLHCRVPFPGEPQALCLSPSGSPAQGLKTAHAWLSRTKMRRGGGARLYPC